MRNPLRSESEAFRFLIATIVGALVIAGAASVNMWLGVAAAVIAVGGILWWLRDEPVPGADRRPRRRPALTGCSSSRTRRSAGRRCGRR